MLGIGGAIGALFFLVGLTLLGMSGSPTRARTWVGPAGAALTTLGIVIVGVSAMSSR